MKKIYVENFIFGWIYMRSKKVVAQGGKEEKEGRRRGKIVS